MNTLTDMLLEIEARANAATPGPIEVYSDGEAACMAAPNEHGGHLCNFYDNERAKTTEEGVPIGKADAEFYANARNDIPRLIAALRAAETALEAINFATGAASVGMAVTANRLSANARARILTILEGKEGE